jgi:hypothetical protein
LNNSSGGVSGISLGSIGEADQLFPATIDVYWDFGGHWILHLFHVKIMWYRASQPSRLFTQPVSRGITARRYPAAIGSHELRNRTPGVAAGGLHPYLLRQLLRLRYGHEFPQFPATAQNALWDAQNSLRVAQNSLRHAQKFPAHAPQSAVKSRQANGLGANDKNFPCQQGICPALSWQRVAPGFAAHHHRDDAE